MPSPPPPLVGPTLEEADSPGTGTAGTGTGAGWSEDLPADLQDQVRGRLRVLTLLLLAAFAFDPILYAGMWVYYRTLGQPFPPDLASRAAFELADLAAALASGLLWRLALHPRLRPSTLVSIGLAYQVLICFVLGFVENLDYFRSHGILPNLDWVPVIVILFPLVLPGPPRRMLAGAVLAAMMSPVSLGVLQGSGQVVASVDAYISSVVHGVFAVFFAYMGARVVYGLGREVARARELGSYRLGALIGRGGMGEVYRASHRMLARPAAIKLIRPELLGLDPVRAQELLRRFQREAQVAASLRSPHTVELYDFGVTPDRTFYFVMELLDGVDLETLVRRTGPLPANRTVFLARQACESLEEAHRQGLVHRDIKPANLHVGRLGLKHDFLKVLDFGLVKSIRASPDSALATRTGEVAGTPAYMAPEVALGEGFDGRADVYALGCVMFFLLTGRTVFEADSPMRVITCHVHEAPTAPSTCTELPVPPALDALVLRCLAKTPAERPLVGALDSALAQLPTSPWSEREAEQWWQVHQVTQ